MTDDPGAEAVLASAERASGEAPARVSRWFLLVFPPAVAAVYVWQVYALPVMHHEPIISPRAWPTGVAIALCAGAVAVSLGVVLRRWGTAPGPPASGIESRRDLWMAIGGLIVFIVLVDSLGYVLAAFLLITGLTMLVAPKFWLRNVVTAAVFALISSVLFSGLLDVRLPQGIIPLPWS